MAEILKAKPVPEQMRYWAEVVEREAVDPKPTLGMTLLMLGEKLREWADNA